MKLIIDIPDEVYENVKSGLIKGVVLVNGCPFADLKSSIPLDKIRAEITAIVINGQVDEHTSFIRTGEQVKQMALNIIDGAIEEGDES